MLNIQTWKDQRKSAQSFKADAACEMQIFMSNMVLAVAVVNFLLRYFLSIQNNGIKAKWKFLKRIKSKNCPHPFHLALVYDRKWPSTWPVFDIFHFRLRSYCFGAIGENLWGKRVWIALFFDLLIWYILHIQN